MFSKRSTPRASPAARPPPAARRRSSRSLSPASQSPSPSLYRPSELIDGLVALKGGHQLALLFGRLTLHDFLLGQHAVVVGAVGNRADHAATAALAGLVHEVAQRLLTLVEIFPSRDELVAVIGV